MPTSQTGPRGAQKSEPAPSGFSATEVSAKSFSMAEAKNQILLEIKNSIMGLQTQMVSFESKIEGKIESLENTQKELLEKV